jgi:hypothetical protein
MPLDAMPRERQRNVATGSDGRTSEQTGASLVAVSVAVKPDKQCKSVATGDNWAEKSGCTKEGFRSAKQVVSAEKKRVADGIRTHDLRNHNPTF